MQPRLTPEDIQALRQLQSQPGSFRLIRHPALCASQFIESNGCGGCRLSAFGHGFLSWLERHAQTFTDLGHGL